MIDVATESLARHALAPPPASGVAPCSTMRATNATIESQASSLRRWHRVYEQLSPGRFVGSVHEACFGSLQVFRETSNQSVHGAGAPWPGSRTVGTPVAISGHALFAGEPLDTAAAITLGSDGELDFYMPRNLDFVAVAVDERALDAHASAVEHRDIGSTLKSAGVLAPRGEAIEPFRRLLCSLLESLEANPAALQYEQTQRVLEQSVLSALVDVAGGSDDARASKPLCAARRDIVERATAHMRANVDQAITVADLCVHLGVSRRTLQYSFQQVLALNPVRFLRAMRLNGVRRDLQAGAAPRSVQDVAAQWGFWHLGHFITDYKRMFGELPSETMRRAAPAARSPRFASKMGSG